MLQHMCMAIVSQYGSMRNSQPFHLGGSGLAGLLPDQRDATQSKHGVIVELMTQDVEMSPISSNSPGREQTSKGNYHHIIILV